MILMTLGEVHEAGIALAHIMNRPRSIPHAAKFKLARLHEAIYPIADRAEKKRYALVHELGEEVPPSSPTETGGWKLKDENKAEYDKRWAEICAEVIELRTTPIPLQVFGYEDQNGIEAHEFRMLGPLVTEVTE